MNQHVDFLKLIPKAKTRLPAELLIAAVVGSLVLLLLSSVLLWIYQLTTNQQLKAAQDAKQKETLVFQKLADTYPLLAGDTPLVTKVVALEKSLNEKEAYFAELTHTTIRKPFSKYLVAISQAVPKGIWLTGIHIDQDGGNISLEGFALAPSLISVFLKNLEQIPPFVGESLDLFAVKKKSDDSTVDQFEVANQQLLNEDLLKSKKDKNNQDDEPTANQTKDAQKINVQKTP